MLTFLFAWLLPLLALLPALTRLRALGRAHRRGLVRPPGWTRLLAGLAAAQGVIVFAYLSLVYPTRLEPPLAALMALAGLLVAARGARAGMHPGLHGLRRPLPRDGLDLIEREQRAARRAVFAAAASRARAALPLLPALLVIALLITRLPERALGLALLGLVLAAPLLLVPYRWQWALPLGLVPPLLVLFSQALVLGAALPPGWWTRPLAAAGCPGVVRLTSDPVRAWCIEPAAGWVSAYDPGRGALVYRHAVPEAARLFAARGALGWVQQNPAQGLVRLSPAAAEPVRIGSAQVGAADPDGRLWVIDVSQELSLYTPEGAEQRLRARDGLLNNTAQVVRVSPAGDVWVGSFSGLSVLRHGAAAWQTIDRDAGVPGAVQALAFGPDGSVWLLWLARPGYGAFIDWGLSALYPDGTWVHRALGPETQVELAQVEDPLAIDAHGRAWIATHSFPQAQRVLILAAPGQPPRLYPQSSSSFSPALWRDAFGVVSDGRGGILLYIDVEGWWHWRP